MIEIILTILAVVAYIGIGFPIVRILNRNKLFPFARFQVRKGEDELFAAMWVLLWPVTASVAVLQIVGTRLARPGGKILEVVTAPLRWICVDEEEM